MALTPMMQQYYTLKEQYPDALLFFRLGDFYEMFGEDAETAARLLQITLTSRDASGSNRIPMCGVPHHSAHSYLVKLVQHGFNVAICEQMEDPKQSKGVVKREVVRVVTPGTFVDIQEDEKRSLHLVGVKRSRRSFGLAVIDPSTGEFRVTSVSSAEALRDELTRLEPAEILFAEGETPFEGTPGRAVARELPARSWSTANCRRRLEEHFGVRSLEGYGLTESEEIGAAGAVLGYIQETQRAALTHINDITRYSLEEYLQIDSASQRNLELTRTIRDGRTDGAVLGVLDHTMTSMGGRLLRHYLERPLLDIEAISERHEAVQRLVDHVSAREELREQLRRVYDIERLLTKLLYGSGNARDLVALKESLRRIPDIQLIVGDLMDAASPGILDELQRVLDPLTELTQQIEQAIIDEPPVSVREGGLIRDGYDSQLDELRAAARGGKQWIADLEAKERERTGIRSLKVGFNKVFGYYLEVTKANIQHVPENYERKQTLANAERFITPELKEKESLVLGAEERMVEMEYRLFCEVRDRTESYTAAIQQDAQAAAQLDAFQSLAHAAVRYRYVRPRIVDTPHLEISQGRHPVVEQIEKAFVPNDLHLDENERVVLLTGPNMAGKSTYLRQNALIVILAQMGSFVPAESAVIGVADRVFTRIGASDDLSTGQSTFMVECAETANLVRHATERSLIILDELGRGTSTFDGMAIAQAVLEYLHDRIQARTLFSTHYHELVKLENNLDRLATHRVEVEERGGHVYFLHQVRRGHADKSYGINVARMAGVPRAVVRRALSLLQKLEAGGDQPIQLDLFKSLAYEEHDEPPFVQELRSLNTDNLTPMEALQTLDRWKRQLEEESYAEDKTTVR